MDTKPEIAIVLFTGEPHEAFIFNLLFDGLIYLI
jgi:hypothetical protein